MPPTDLRMFGSGSSKVRGRASTSHTGECGPGSPTKLPSTKNHWCFELPAHVIYWPFLSLQHSRSKEVQPPWRQDSDKSDALLLGWRWHRQRGSPPRPPPRPSIHPGPGHATPAPTQHPGTARGGLSPTRRGVQATETEVGTHSALHLNQNWHSYIFHISLFHIWLNTSEQTENAVQWFLFILMWVLISHWSLWFWQAISSSQQPSERQEPSSSCFSHRRQPSSQLWTPNRRVCVSPFRFSFFFISIALFLFFFRILLSCFLAFCSFLTLKRFFERSLSFQACVFARFLAEFLALPFKERCYESA